MYIQEVRQLKNAYKDYGQSAGKKDLRTSECWCNAKQFMSGKETADELLFVRKTQEE